MDTVLGVSMAPTAVRMVLVEGANGDGVTVDQDNIEIPAADEASTISAADQIVAAILGTREGAAQGGYQLASTGVTFTDPVEAAALRDALAAHKLENVMLVSAFLAAAALAQAVGNQTNYAHTALLYVEPGTATLAIVESADGSIVDVQRQPLPDDQETAMTQLATMVSGIDTLETRPDAVFVVGSGVDIAAIKSRLEAATTLPLSVPEEPDTALARGAALAAANAPLFASSTEALAYAQDPGTGFIDPLAVAPGYFDAATDAGTNSLAYSAVADDGYTGEFAAYTGEYTGATQIIGTGYREHRSFWLVGGGVAAIFVIGVVALVVSLAIAIRPTAGERPAPEHPVVAPTQAAPPPAAPASAPAAPPPAAPPPTPEAPAPAPDAPSVIPEEPPPAPVPEAPAPAPPPVVRAPAPVYVPPPPPPPPPPEPAPAPCGRGPLGRCHPFLPH